MIGQHKKKKLRAIIKSGGYNPARGYIDWGMVDVQWKPVGKYIKYPKNSKQQRFNKRHSDKIARRNMLPKKQWIP